MDNNPVSPAVPTKYLYQKHEGGIHEFIFLDFSRDGADAFLEGYERIAGTFPDDAPPRLLIDSSRGTMPIKYIFGRGRELQQRIPLSKQRYRVAVILAPGLMNHIFASMMSIFPQTLVRVFTPDERDAAVDWLMKV